MGTITEESPRRTYVLLAIAICAATLLPASAYALLAAPSPSGPSGSGVSTTPTFSWSSVTGANRYWLVVSTNSADLPTDPSATSCSGCVSTGLSGVTNLTSFTAGASFPYGGTTRVLSPGTTYYWKVQGFNTNGTQGNYSTLQSFNTASSLLPAPSPSGPTGTGISTTPTFGWSSVTGANRYWLTVSTSSGDLPTDPNATSCSGCVSTGLSGVTNLASFTAGASFPYGGTTRVLSPGTTYYWKVQGFNTNGTQGNYSTQQSFTTASTAVPTITTGAATNLTTTGATLNGTVNANGVSTSTSFDYGLDAGYGLSAAAQSFSDSVSHAISASISGLACGTTYHFRAKASGSGSPVTGSDVTFTTTACSGTTALTWPIPSLGYGAVGQDFAQAFYGSVNADHPYHSALDIGAAQGTTVVAAGAGTVRSLPMTAGVFNGDNHCMGNVLIIDHSDGQGTGPFTLYAHLLDFVVTSGHVNQGAPIAHVGQTPTVARAGCSPPDNPHLHFEVKSHGTLGNSTDDGTYWGYTPPMPDQYGYEDPVMRLHGAQAAAASPAIVTAAGAGVALRIGPHEQYRCLISSTGSSTCRALVAGEAFTAVASAPSTAACSAGWVKVTSNSGNFADYSRTAVRVSGQTAVASEIPDAWVCRGNAGQVWVDSQVQQVVTGIPYDFNGDKTSDILWRHSSTGENYLWTMSGAALASGHMINVIADANWKIAAVADFNGDGKADILWRHATTGDVYIYLMNGSSVIGQGALDRVADLNWTIAGTGDYDGDGKADILWRHATTGANYIYFMNGAAISSAGALEAVATNWKIVASGDLNADSRADIVWRNTVNGDAYAWLMNGRSIIGRGYIAGGISLSWTIAAASDFDGDGNADIFWRNESTGENYLYLMNGTKVVSGGRINVLPDLNWKVAATADYDGDGKTDILWRNAVTGENYIYLMNGFQIVGGRALQPIPDTRWKIIR